jgi:predicted AAA+ superfamily ATPase
MPGIVERHALELVERALATARVTLVHGPRQAGKSTLVRAIGQRHGFDYVTFDDRPELEAALADPAGYLRSYGRPLVIDEVQRAGSELILAIKSIVDRESEPGQFLLTGSTNFLTLPTLSESLTGRVRIVRLHPFSLGERAGRPDDFIDRALLGIDALLGHRGPTPDRDYYLEAACLGGFAGVTNLSGRDRDAWFDDYIDTLLQREIATAADIRRWDLLGHLARLMTARTGSELVIGRIATDLELDRSTVEHYIAWLETAFLLHRVPAWGRNPSTKTVRRPKLYAADSGLAASMLGKNAKALRAPTEPATGPVVETLVVGELLKQSTWSATTVGVHHMRSTDGREVDILLEARDGRVIGIEVKSTTTPRSDDFRWLHDLRDRVDKAQGAFVAGIVLHTGTARLPFGDRLVALPIADLSG